MSKLLVIVDMQNDFIKGSLGIDGSEKMVNNIYSLATDFVRNNYYVIFTHDTHEENYLETQEGRNLPIKHCIKGTEGWELYGKLKDIKGNNVYHIEKETFPMNPSDVIYFPDLEEILLVGVATNMCVISNAVILKAIYPEVPIKVIDSLCDAPTKEGHDRAIEVLKDLQIEII